jgi:Holliday junction resolvase
MTASNIITKASGERVPFSAHKLENSLKRAGAAAPVIDEIVKKVTNSLFEGITTREIYHIAFELLKNKTSSSAAKYKLKHAIMELGPSGFPFEKYFAERLKHQGFKTKVDQVVQGHCVSHEIDVIAEKGEKYFMVECKFHNQTGFVCDVKIPLYIQSRFKDVEYSLNRMPDQNSKFHQGWVVTNTRFSSDAIQYGNCVGLHLVGWDHPHNGSLRDQIDQSGLYPLTCLTTLRDEEKASLLSAGIVLSKEFTHNQAPLSKIGISPERITAIVKESSEICAGGLR